MPFYKLENNELLVAPNFVVGPGFELRAETHAEHTYPVDGWYWFDTLDAAMTAMVNINAQTITMRQCRLQLLTVGLLDSVDAAIAAIPDAAQRRAAQIEWEYAAVVERNSDWVQNLAGALGLTDVQLDTLFSEAAKL